LLSKDIFLILPPYFLKHISMNYLRQFIIPFSGLKPGVHHYDLVIDNKFFESLDYSTFRKGSLTVGVELNRQERMLIFDFDIHGTVEVECDRCLDLIKYPVNTNRRLIFKFGEKWEDLTDEIVIIPESEYQIDLSHFFYEFISLTLPMRRVHPDDAEGNSTCNQEMLKFLGYHPSGKVEDPRWEALKKLKNK